MDGRYRYLFTLCDSFVILFLLHFQKKWDIIKTIRKQVCDRTAFGSCGILCFLFYVYHIVEIFLPVFRMAYQHSDFEYIVADNPVILVDR